MLLRTIKCPQKKQDGCYCNIQPKKFYSNTQPKVSYWNTQSEESYLQQPSVPLILCDITVEKNIKAAHEAKELLMTNIYY